MEIKNDISTLAKPSSLRWSILRRTFLRRPSPISCDGESQKWIEQISRKSMPGFNLIPSQRVYGCLDETPASLTMSNNSTDSRDACLCYTLPTPDSPKLFLIQRVDDQVSLGDFEICNKYNVDNTGLVRCWPSEDVLAYYCLLHGEMFRSKRIIELGSGCGLAGLVVAVVTDATEVVISDGNPQVVDYIERNIDANSRSFKGTAVRSLLLHWNEWDQPELCGSFDIIIASDCTFFEEFQEGLAESVGRLMKKDAGCEAIFFSPKRGSTLNKFLAEISKVGLHYSVSEKYDPDVWKLHRRLLNGPNYVQDHCYPLLLKITL